MRNGLFVAALAGLALVLAACSDGTEVAAGGGLETGSPDAVSAGSTAMCVEIYSPETLKKREAAFAGTVEAVTPGEGDEPGSVRFRVDEWFAGGSADTATLKGYGAGSGAITSNGGPSIEPGARLLVAGDDGFIWECGFTQAYSAETAAEWRAALSG